MDRGRRASAYAMPVLNLSSSAGVTVIDSLFGLSPPAARRSVSTARPPADADAWVDSACLPLLRLPRLSPSPRFLVSSALGSSFLAGPDPPVRPLLPEATGVICASGLASNVIAEV